MYLRRMQFVLFALFALFISAHAKAETERVVVIPPGIREVSEEAFAGDTGITHLVIYEGVSIGENAFSGCTNLKTLIVVGDPDISFRTVFTGVPIRNVYCGRGTKADTYFRARKVNVHSLSAYPSSDVFTTDFRLTGVAITGYMGMEAEIEVPSKILGMPVTEIAENAFLENMYIEKIHLPQSVSVIGENAFMSCPSLKTVETDGVIKRIGAHAFEDCERLSDIPLADGLVYVGDFAFKNCRSLLNTHLPEGASAGEDVFKIDPRVEGTALNIIPLYQFNYTKTICVFSGEERSVKTSGCGATCVAMVIRFKTGNYDVTPESIFEWAYKTGYYKGDGLSHLSLSRALTLNGIKSRWTKSTTEVIACLKAGRPVIAHMGPGLFADNGHYILLRGIDENGLILVNDPNSRELTGQAFPIDFIKSQLKVYDGFCLIRE